MVEYSLEDKALHSTELKKDLSLRLIAKRLQRFYDTQFPSCWPWPRVLIYFKKLTPEIGGWNWKTTFANYASEGGGFMQSLPSFLTHLVPVLPSYRNHSIDFSKRTTMALNGLISLVVIYTLMPWLWALLHLPNYWSDSRWPSLVCRWRRWELVWSGGQVNSLAKRFAWWG